MPDMSKLIEKVTKKVGNKKAKVKPYKEDLPSDTKEKKLPKDLQSALEEKFSVDLKHVRVHTGKGAEEAAKKLKARAFTCGTNLYLGKASDLGNKEFLAHELAHVIQKYNGKKIPREGKGKVLTSK